MIEQTYLVPRRRFREFQDTDAWEQRKLSDLAEVRTGKAFSSVDFSDDGEYLVVTNKNILDEANGIPSVGDRIDISEVTILDNYLLRGDNILVTMDGVNIGKTGKYSNEKAVLAQRVGRLNSEQLEFVYQITRSDKFVSEMNKLSVGNAIKHISLKQISDYSFSAPISEEEQEKIGTFFNQLDNLITLHQRKLDKTKALKSAYLSEMFPVEGESEPKRRFAGFTDAWEQRTLGEHAKFRRGSFPQPYGKKMWYDGDGAMPFVQVVDVTGQLVLVDETKQKISRLAQPMSVFVPKGKIIVTLQGSIGRVAITQYDSFVDRTLLIFEGYEKLTDEHFWAYTIQQKFEIEKQKAPGGTIKTITKEALSSFDIFLPEYEEQKKIGEFFKQLDNLITLHRYKLEKLKNIKKAYLNEMFI